MGGIPSRESPSLFSYFRGSYEVGLIPLTKQFFGREDEEPRHAVGSSSGQNQYKGVNRGQLRRQLLLMRQDPAVRYSNSRDSHSIIQSIMAFLEKEDKKTTSLGDLPTEKDVHTSPLRSSSAATSSEALPEKGERGTATAAANEISLGELGEDLEAALHDLVKDPAEIARVREAIWKHYWSVMPENHFTESDLDAFLNLVEATLYDTDRDMLLDPLYPKPDHAQLGENSSSASRPSAFFPVPCALCLAYPEGKERDGCFTLDGRNINIIGYFGLLTQDMERALKVSKRDCSSSKSQMNGGEQVQQNGSADVPKHVFSLPKSRTSLDTLDSMRADGAVYETLNKPDNYKSAGEHELFLNTAILTSAGDRTLERVLVLAAVMLRQQFHAAYRRYLIQKKELSACAIPSGAIESTSGLNPPVHIITAPQANPVYATSSIPGVSIPTSALSNPLLGCTLPPLPSNMFTPLPLGGSPEAIANAAITHSYFLRPGKPDSSTSSSQLQWIEGTGSQHYVCEQGGVSGGLISISAAEEDSMSQALANRLEQLAVSIEIASNNYTSLKSLTENFAFLHCQVSLDSDDACMELVDLPVISSNTAVSFEKQSNNNSVNNISSYSVQNASMSSKNHAMAGEPEGMSSRSMSHDVHLDSVGSPVQNREDGPSEKPQDHSAFQLSPSSAIILHMQPSYFRQSCMWASCLFHFPARLLGHWVQYKLKDECDHLRHVLQNKDMLIAQWRQFHREHALSYLGEHTVRLLQHVRALQDETERARTLPITNWDPDNLFINLDGRKYALHNSQFGTMLIGVRTPHATGANTSSSNNIGSFSGKRNGNSSSALDFMHEHANDLNAQRNRNAPMHFPAGVAYNNGATFLAAAPQTMHMSPPQFHNVTTMAGPTGPAAVPTALPGSVAMMMGRTPPQAHGVVPQPMYPAFQASPGAIPFTVASGNTAAMPMGAQNAYIISPGSGKITPGIATGPPSSTASPAQNIVYMDQSHTMMMNGMRMMLPTCSSQALNPVSQPPVSSSPQASPGNLVLAGPLPTTANPNTYHDPRNFARTALPQMSSSPTGAPFFPLQTAGVPAPTAYYLGSMGETPGNKASMPSVVSGNDLTPGMSSFELPSVLPTRPVADYTGGHSNNPSNNSSRHTLPSTTVLHPSFQSPSVPLMASSPGQFVSNTQNITNTVKPGGSAPPQFTYTLCNGVPVMCVPQMDAQAVPTRVDTTSGTVPANPLQPPQSQSSTSQHPMYTLSMSPPGGFQQPQSAPSFMYQPTYF